METEAIFIWNDPEISALKLELKNLENQLNTFDNEKSELEKLLMDFQYKHTIELGNIILEILKLRRLKYKSDKAKFEEAENDFNQYNDQFEIQKKKSKFELTEDEKKELKKKFRKASFLCHPDKVNDELKDAAQKIFIQLKTAYEANDLKKVSEILNDIEKGDFFKTKSDTVSEKDLIKAAIEKFRIQIKNKLDEIAIIKQSETFKTVIEIKDWNEYFKTTKEELKKEFEKLNTELIVQQTII